MARCSREMCAVAYDPALWRALLLADYAVGDPAAHPLLPPPHANGQMELRLLYVHVRMGGASDNIVFGSMFC